MVVAYPVDFKTTFVIARGHHASVCKAKNCEHMIALPRMFDCNLPRFSELLAKYFHIPTGTDTRVFDSAIHQHTHCTIDCVPFGNSTEPNFHFFGEGDRIRSRINIYARGAYCWECCGDLAG